MRADLIVQVQTLLAEGGDKKPPVHLWNPPLSGDIDIRIAADGRWYHEGAVFERHALVCLFASLLKREGDDYFLVTPVEKWRLRVEGVPFVAIDCEVLGAGADQQLVFTTNVGDRVHCNAAHPLQLLPLPSGGPMVDRVPCVTVRDGLCARLARSVYYRLLEGDEPAEHEGMYGVWSGGEFFVLGSRSAD